MSGSRIVTTFTSTDSIVKNEETSDELINPFVHHLELTSTYEKVKTGFFTVVVLPIRLFFISCLMIAVWVLACIGLYGLSEEELRQKPISGWRSKLKSVASFVIRLLFFACGFHYVKVKGAQAKAEEAPILAVAPHSSFFDALPVIILGSPSVVARAENGNMPFFGKLINYTQPVYVWRDDPNSRQKTIQEIINRAKSDLDWPQMLIFPEGTCTNRSCLITFKPGAFYPGVPVQPVLLRYPNKLDTVTWTWDGPGALKLLWLTLTQSHSSCEIEFLPVYKPSEAEKADPKLYAHNVRLLMANALGVPTTNYTYEDCLLSSKAKEMNIPVSSIIIQTHKLRSRLGLVRRHTEERLLQENPDWLTSPEVQNVTCDKFSALLNVPDYDVHLSQLFKLFLQETNPSNVIDFREYMLCVCIASEAKQGTNLIKLAFKLCGRTINSSQFVCIMNVLLCLKADEVLQLFDDISGGSQSTISYGDFKGFVKDNPDLLSKCGNLLNDDNYSLINNNLHHLKEN
nr:PREDICTED: lysophosphatidylcholine acyltransferase isoform X1 [Bemisia tabaci]